MILKIRRSMSHADGLKSIQSYLYIDGITSIDVCEVRLKRGDSDGGPAMTVVHEPGLPNEVIFDDIIWSDEKCSEDVFCRAVVNVPRDAVGDVSWNRVYYFATEAFLMNDSGKTIDRLVPGM